MIFSVAAGRIVVALVTSPQQLTFAVSMSKSTTTFSYALSMSTTTSTSSSTSSSLPNIPTPPLLRNLQSSGCFLQILA